MSKERPLKRLGFAHIVPIEPANPARSLEEALQLFEFAEALGLDSGWVRTRHLQRALPSASVFHAAASQRTSRIDLGSATIPAAHENPFRLAEDLAVADHLSGGRLQPALSVHAPRYDDRVNDVVFGDGWREEDFTYGRLERLLGLIRGEKVRSLEEGSGGWGNNHLLDSEHVEPLSAGLADRLWYGGGSLRSAQWAGEAGLKWIVSNISTSENGVTDFAEAQRRQIDVFRAHHPQGDAAVVAQGHVVVPTDGATPAQVRKYRAYVEGREARTHGVQGKNTLIERDNFGSLDEILETFANDIAFSASDEFVFELPFEFELDDYKHILEQLATRIGPALGWTPAEGTEPSGADLPRLQRTA